MGAFICKQPNGLYCRFSSVVDSLTHWNMTEEEYIEFCAERAREEARFTLQHRLKPFERVVEYFAPREMTNGEFEKILKDVGYKE